MQVSDDLYTGRGQTDMGVNAMINSTTSVQAIPTINAGGSGYAVGDYVQLLGGWGEFCIAQVLTAPAGVVGSLSIYSAGNYQATVPGILATKVLTGGGNGALTVTPTYAPAIPMNPSTQERGIGPLGRTFVYDIMPAPPASANIAALQTPAAAGNLVLTAGTNILAKKNTQGQSVLQLDFPRTISVTQAAAGTQRTFTVSGYDMYGQPMTEAITSTVSATVNGKKAFYTILSIAVNGGTTTNASVGVSNVFGMPVRVLDAGYVDRLGWGALAQDTGTLVGAVLTPASSSTGDVRGTYAPSTNADGKTRLVVEVLLTNASCGFMSTRAASLGVTQA